MMNNHFASSFDSRLTDRTEAAEDDETAATDALEAEDTLTLEADEALATEADEAEEAEARLLIDTATCASGERLADPLAWARRRASLW
jgi:hypothetical protein